MSSAALPPTLFKKNGTINGRKCAEFYGVRPPTFRLWYRSGAPLHDPRKMEVWLREREQERLRKIGSKEQSPCEQKKRKSSVWPFARDWT